MLKPAINKLMRREDLTEAEIMEAMNCIMEGSATQAQIGGFLTGLRVKGETADEITGCARVMRDKAERINPKVGFCVDTCGTGGDGANTFNISTAAAIVAAAGGAVVAKHGNRAMSGRSGSADVLEALGVNIMLTPEQVEKCMEEIGIGFMFAQAFHKSMKHAAGPRRELGTKTIFNILGPLTNPAGAKGQVLGVFDESLTDIMAEVLQKLGSERALVVSGTDGLDEITTTAPTKISELKDGVISQYYLDTADFGLSRANRKDLEGGDASTNAQIIRSVFAGEKGPRRDIVLINAAAALYVAKVADTLREGVSIASDVIDSGRAAEKLAQLCEITKET